MTTTTMTTGAATRGDDRHGVVYRPMAWEDVDAIVEEYERTWGFGTPESALLSRHFVMHYLAPASRGDIAERDGRFMGVTLTRVAGLPAAFPEAQAELGRIDDRIRASVPDTRHLDGALHWHAVEEEMERDSGVEATAQGEIELFLVSADARDHGVGGTLWRRALAYLGACGVERYYLHTDSSCDVGFYDHQGLECVAERYAADHPEDHDMMGDIFIYEGAVSRPAPTGGALSE